MDAFVNKINPEGFRSINDLWNELKLNDPWNVGYVSTLVKVKHFSNKEEWETFYYDNGEERNQKVFIHAPHIIKLLNDPLIKYARPGLVANLPFEIKTLNNNYGRTQVQIMERGRILFDKARERLIDISLDECVEAVRFRTICET